ncbi:5326_t:CDS:2, partial [Gigaspora margarita]
MPKDQFQGSIVQSMNIGIKNYRIDRIILVSKMDNKKKDKKISEVEDMNKYMDIAKSGDNKINNLLFNPEESVFFKNKSNQ